MAPPSHLHLTQLRLPSALTTSSTSPSAGQTARRMASLRNHRNLRHTPQHAAYLLLYELKQGASIHILAREVRGAAEDKGIGSGAARRGEAEEGDAVW